MLPRPVFSFLIPQLLLSFTLRKNIIFSPDNVVQIKLANNVKRSMTSRMELAPSSLLKRERKRGVPLVYCRLCVAIKAMTQETNHLFPFEESVVRAARIF
jgi:hypothetical protein